MLFGKKKDRKNGKDAAEKEIADVQSVTVPGDPDFVSPPEVILQVVFK